MVMTVNSDTGDSVFSLFILGWLVWLVLDPIFWLICLGDRNSYNNGRLAREAQSKLSEWWPKFKEDWLQQRTFDVFDETPEQDDGGVITDRIRGEQSSKMFRLATKKRLQSP